MTTAAPVFTSRPPCIPVNFDPVYPAAIPTSGGSGSLLTPATFDSYAVQRFAPPDAAVAKSPWTTIAVIAGIAAVAIIIGLIIWWLATRQAPTPTPSAPQITRPVPIVQTPVPQPINPTPASVQSQTPATSSSSAQGAPLPAAIPQVGTSFPVQFGAASHPVVAGAYAASGAPTPAPPPPNRAMPIDARDFSMTESSVRQVRGETGVMRLGISDLERTDVSTRAVRGIPSRPQGEHISSSTRNLLQPLPHVSTDPSRAGCGFGIDERSYYGPTTAIDHTYETAGLATGVRGHLGASSVLTTDQILARYGTGG